MAYESKSSTLRSWLDFFINDPAMLIFLPVMLMMFSMIAITFGFIKLYELLRILVKKIRNLPPEAIESFFKKMVIWICYLTILAVILYAYITLLLKDNSLEVFL